MLGKKKVLRGSDGRTIYFLFRNLTARDKGVGGRGETRKVIRYNRGEVGGGFPLIFTRERGSLNPLPFLSSPPQPFFLLKLSKRQWRAAKRGQDGVLNEEGESFSSTGAPYLSNVLQYDAMAAKFKQGKHSMT